MRDSRTESAPWSQGVWAWCTDGAPPESTSLRAILGGMGEFLMGVLAIPLLVGWFYLLHWLLTVVGFFRR